MKGNWVEFERPSGEGCYKPYELKWVFFVLMVVVVNGWEIGGYEAKRGVLCTEAEEIVRVKLAFFYYTATRCALGYATTYGCGAVTLCGGVARALHCLVVVVQREEEEEEKQETSKASFFYCSSFLCFNSQISTL
ncbi:hypothetical protein OIU76_014757 [Salix suchowensis]|nr:hypothetical protein OIU76_014757 [Salix suchowensis]